MADEESFREVAQAIGETLMVDPATITRATTADDVNGWDSVTHSMLVMEIERRLGIQLPMDKVFDLADVGELVDLVAAARSAG
ncbi:acyl carrier protein [Roseomonas sp. NAR14]|uniref:Acyl carrier protein n=1 Tax=Roseomonas acroporae TaxID=2937791 RepID=A0A9X2BTU4_9PROT|nr:acyl carrier protein [Roseomonas acroporae]MCK8783506.1 acyl carrier protein [Roseomonas acroporae]